MCPCVLKWRVVTLSDLTSTRVLCTGGGGKGKQLSKLTVTNPPAAIFSTVVVKKADYAKIYKI